VIAALRSAIPGVNDVVGRWSEQLSHAKECIQLPRQRQKRCAPRHRRSAPLYHPGDELLLSIKQIRLNADIKLS
jgi:hypothetical protein